MFPVIMTLLSKEASLLPGQVHRALTHAMHTSLLYFLLSHLSDTYTRAQDYVRTEMTTPDKQTSWHMMDSH